MRDNKSIIDLDLNFKHRSSNIYKLSELKPAGTKLILEPKTDLIELLKLTLFDLALKQVLIIKKVLKKSHPKDPYLREYIIVETGKNFSKYLPSQFENFFINRIDEESYYHLRTYLTEIFKDIESEFRYKRDIINDLKINFLFKTNIVYKIFSLLRINNQGNILKKEIANFLNQVDENIGHLIENEPQKALELILFLQGNIFLLKSLNFELLEKIKSFRSVNINYDDEYSQDLYWFDFIYDSDLFTSDISLNVSEIFDSLDNYFDSGSDWSGDYDFYID